MLQLKSDNDRKAFQSWRDLSAVNDWLTGKDTPLGSLYNPQGSVGRTEESRAHIWQLTGLFLQAQANPNETLTAALNKALGKYVSRPHIWFYDDSMFVSEEPVRQAAAPPQGEIAAAYALVRLAQYGILSRLKICPCDKLFLPGRKGQKNCSAACSRKQYNNTERAKAHRRDYMRKYYADNFKKG
ncbi:MAG TPA: hypothetical protein VIY29_07500 [Ktedonobacteraceae bacterium]